MISLEGVRSKIQDFRLDPQDMSSWPVLIKLLLVILVFLLTLFVGYKLVLSSSITGLSDSKLKEQKLRQAFSDKAFKSANLEQYQLQLAAIKASFDATLKKLPGKTEMPGLIDDITLAGVISGLTFNKIEVKPEIKADFYAELPIHISVKGNYHALGAFVSGVAALPRIVTLHDFTIAPDADSGRLKMDILARTYRYTQAEAVQ
jgi:type IV pilus assembly protein PilO